MRDEQGRFTHRRVNCWHPSVLPLLREVGEQALTSTPGILNRVGRDLLGLIMDDVNIWVRPNILWLFQPRIPTMPPVVRDVSDNSPEFVSRTCNHYSTTNSTPQVSETEYDPAQGPSTFHCLRCGKLDICMFTSTYTHIYCKF